MSLARLFVAPRGLDATSLRALGVRGVLIGAPLFVLGVLWFLLTRKALADDLAVGPYTSSRARTICIAPLAVGYFLLMNGLLRIVLGRYAEASSILASIVRILFALLVTFGLIAVILIVAVRG
jgi:hypothetical protein